MRQYVEEASVAKKMGRPVGPKGERRKDRITVPLNKAELGQIEAARATWNAENSQELTAATFCRMVLMKATEPRGKKAGA